MHEQAVDTWLFFYPPPQSMGMKLTATSYTSIKKLPEKYGWQCKKAIKQEW